MAESLAQLIATLRSAEPTERAAAAEALSRLGPEAQAAAVPLVECAASDGPLGEWAVAALEELGPPAAEQIPELATLLARREVNIAYWAATLLGRAESTSAPAVAALTTALQSHGELAVRERAAWALGKIGPAAAPAGEALHKASSAPEKRLAKLAQEALDAIGNA